MGFESKNPYSGLQKHTEPDTQTEQTDGGTSASAINTVCAECSAFLSRDEISLTKKLIGGEITEFYCFTCLAERYKVTEDTLHGWIEKFRKEGCPFFM